MVHVLLVIHVVVTAALIGAVLIQRSDTDGFGLGGGSGSSLMTGRATANLLTRTTSVLATLFIVLSLALSLLAAHGTKSSIADRIAQEGDAAVPLAIEQDDDSSAIAPEVNRDEAVDTDRAAKQEAADKAEPKAENDDAPAVPAAE